MLPPNKQKDNEEGRNCVKVQYETQVAIPKFFGEYMPSAFTDLSPLHMTKTVCTQNNELSEQIIMKNVPVIDILHMDVKGKIENDVDVL